LQTGSITLASTRLEGKQIVNSQRTQAPVSLACLLPPGTVAFRLATGGGGSELAAGSAQWPHTAVRHHRPSGTHTFGFTVEIRKATRKRHSHVGAVCEQGRHYKVRYSLFAHTKRKKKTPAKTLKCRGTDPRKKRSGLTGLGGGGGGLGGGGGGGGAASAKTMGTPRSMGGQPGGGPPLASMRSNKAPASSALLLLLRLLLPV